MGMDEYIPDGFSPLADWDHKRRGNNDGHSLEWKALNDAVKAGEIAGFRLPNGRWYVHREQACGLLLKAAEPVTVAAAKTNRKLGTQDAQADASVVALYRIDNGIAYVLTVLERLTTAVESMATQPRTEEQVREAIMTACKNADGFDSFRS